jgi:FMN phosphatase YigB (HAD superfamily)
LRKADVQTAWGTLHPADFPVPKQCHVWWELKNQYETQMYAVKKNGASLTA